MLIDEPGERVIRALDPHAVIAYLRRKGWERKRDFGVRAAVFGRSVDGIEHELLVPLAQDARDYPRVLEVMIEDLAKVEHRSPYEVFPDLRS
jgi:hypothetical protein